VTVCKTNGLIPSNLTLAEKYGLVESKVLLTFKLENRLQQDAYIKYLTEGKGSYIFTEPETGVCPLPLGIDNAPVIELESPLDGSKYKKSASIDIKGEVRFLESITEFTISIDGNVIPGATLEDGKFAVTYSLSTLSVGEHILAVYAKDNYEKSSTKSIKFAVEEDEVSVELPIVKPGNRTNS